MTNCKNNKLIMDCTPPAGLLKEILVELNIEFDETDRMMETLEGQKLLDTKMKGITSYACELLHYGYNVSLELLRDTMRDQGTTILEQFMEQFGGMHDAMHPVMTMEKLTYIFDKDLYEECFGVGNDPFTPAEKN